jgi:arylsulfatase A-like enzyme
MKIPDSDSDAGSSRAPSPDRRVALSMRRMLAAAALGAAALAGACSLGSSGESGQAENVTPNILFVILDDVGIDQLSTIGYGGATAPKTPTIDAVSLGGIRFRNAWSMPECSPGRAAMMVGRYPLRTNIYQAIGPNDLAQSQVTPYDVTVPKLLKAAGYESAMFGKFHLAGPDNNPDQSATPGRLGWDYFYGWIDGLPASIDTTAGGLAKDGTYACGYVPSLLAGGADRGACRFPDGACTELTLLTAAGDSPGKRCVAQGGLFAPSASCTQAPPPGLDFNRQNAHYVSPLVIGGSGTLEVVPLTDARARGYRTTIEVDAAIGWIRSRSTATPWMATMSFSAAHTPLQQPPSALVPAGSVGTDDLNCRNPAVQRLVQNQMIEALDTELGRLLVETGLARRNRDGSLAYNPAATNTVIVIVGDNGSLGTSVKLPFDATRAKSTAYQTGVWVPLVVAGPMVVTPDRDVEGMVNMVDVFRLFGELAGLDVPASVPRKLDAETMLPYLTQPSHPSIRNYNFAQGGLNLQANGGNNGPCLFTAASPGSCSLTPMSKSVCQDNGGVWWGAGATDGSVPEGQRGVGYANCCEVQRAVLEQSGELIKLFPNASVAIRNTDYKLVRNSTLAYERSTDSCVVQTSNELYRIDQRSPVPKLDTADEDLTQMPLTASLQVVYDELTAQLASILASEKVCKGDGNSDGVVDEIDLANVTSLARSWKGSSVYDVNLDGVTDAVDIELVRAALGPCPR